MRVLDEHHDGHGEDPVDLAGNSGELAASVGSVDGGFAIQLNGEEEVGLEEAGFDLGFFEEGGFAGEFVVGELEEEFGFRPIGEEGFLIVEGGVGIALSEEVEEGLGLGVFELDGLVALVAEGIEQIE
jgi:hypothetical protein